MLKVASKKSGKKQPCLKTTQLFICPSRRPAFVYEWLRRLDKVLLSLVKRNHANDYQRQQLSELVRKCQKELVSQLVYLITQKPLTAPFITTPPASKSPPSSESPASGNLVQARLLIHFSSVSFLYKSIIDLP